MPPERGSSDLLLSTSRRAPGNYGAKTSRISNRSAWMLSEVFQRWLKSFNDRSGKQRTAGLAAAGQCPDPCGLKNIRQC
ncbi:hypothetical protein PsorP6_010084 [Peronosclerospora sorghi]|uniref:Uncharacterized protein n=1 Tax=Peronosclerospora sorghi TaxID=230839 RepID=A0ACC0VXX8_9STRA|nr:hypothetical protein PsorP6_010084 [Peronosclerospora sorghi]